MDPITGFLVNLIIGVIFSVGSTLLKQAFAPKAEKRTGTRGSAQFGGKVPQYFLVGTVGEPGKHEYRNAWGSAGGVPNAFLTDVHSFGDLPITALTGLFVNGVKVTLATSGAVAQGYPVPEYNDGSDHFWRKFLDGSQTAADSYLTSTFGSDVDRAWTADMIGRGVPVLITTALLSETLWTGFPSFVGEFQGIKLYDPRKDSTAGGSGAERWDTPSTWAFSDNNAVVIYNIERGIYYEGRHIWGGRKTAAEMPYVVWAAAMDACDAPVSLVGGGTEKRFRGGRRINLNERPADVIKEFLIGANARISHASDGMVYIIVGVPDTADGAFTDADVLATEPLGSIPFPSLDEIINGATATYREPTQAWEDKETAPYYRSDLEEEDDGRQQLEGLDLGTTFSGTQSQRVLKAVIEEGRRFGTHVVALPPEFAQYRPLQVLAWTSERFGYAAKLFLITARTRSPWGQVVFGLQEIDPADHDWTPGTDEQPLSFAPVVTNRPVPQEVSGFYVEPEESRDNDDVGRRPCIDVFWSAASVAVDVRSVRISIWLNAASNPDVDAPVVGALVWEGDVPPIGGSARLTEGILPNVYYVVQIRYISESGRPTVESSLFPVKSRNVKLGPLDIDIELDAIAADLVAQLDWIKSGVRGAIELFKAIGTTLEESDRETFNERRALARSVEVEMDGLRASFDEVIEVALGPGGAIATSLSSLYAAMGGGSAEVNVKWEAMATPVGFGAQYGVALKAGDGEFRTATMYGRVPTNPALPTQWVFDANQIVFSGDGGATVYALFDASGALIRNLRTATIEGPAGNFWNLTTGGFRVSGGS